MGLFDSALEFIGLKPDLSGAIGMSGFSPVDVQTSMGGVSYDEGQKLFTSQLDPRLLGAQQNILSQLQGIDPTKTLGLLRERARPFEKQQMLDLENRLFSQGLLGASGVDRPGGA